MKESIRTTLKFVERCEMFAAKAILLTMIVVVGMQVVFRYGLRRGLSWPEELSGFLLIWLTFLVADILVKRSGHIDVRYFSDKLSQRAQLVISFVVNLYLLGFLVFLVISSIELAMRQTTHLVGAALRLPKTYYTLAATVSGVSMFLSVALSQWETLEKLSALRRKDGNR